MASLGFVQLAVILVPSLCTLNESVTVEGAKLKNVSLLAIIRYRHQTNFGIAIQFAAVTTFVSAVE